MEAVDAEVAEPGLGPLWTAWGLALLEALPVAAPVEPFAPLRAAPARRWGEGLTEAPPPPPPGSAAALVQAFAAWNCSPRDAIERLLARVEQRAFGLAGHSPFSDLDPERARAEADASGRRYRRGTARGPLDGVPVPIKDQHAVRGLPTRAGTAYRLSPEARDGSVAARLRVAGAVLPGTTRSTEWGLCPVGRSPHAPCPRNPHDPGRAAGGSSTGAAVAVSLGLAPVAVGSDGGGSLRIPAALTGLFALKPTWRARRARGDAFGPSTLCSDGPIATCAQDLLALLEALPGGGPGPTRAACRDALGRGLRGCRVGVIEEAWGLAPAAIAGPGRALLGAMEAEGARLVALRPGSALLDLAQPLGVAAVAAGAGPGLARELAVHGDRLGADLRLCSSLFGRIGPSLRARAAAQRRAFQRELAVLLAGVDLLALPSTLAPAPAYPREHDGRAILDPAEARALCRHTFVANLAGLPAATLPAGAPGEFPVGLQLVADAWDEASLLAAIAQLERCGASAVPRPPGWRPLEAP